MDDFMNKMGLVTLTQITTEQFDGADDINEWFEETNLTTGVSVTNMNIAKNLVEKIEELLDGKAHYFECSDRTTYHQKIVIEFNHTNK